MTLFIFSQFIRAISTSPFPPTHWRMHILVTETQLAIFLDHIHCLRMAWLGTGVFFFLVSILKHCPVFLQVTNLGKPPFSHCWHCFLWSHTAQAQAEQRLYGFSSHITCS